MPGGGFPQGGMGQDGGFPSGDMGSNRGGRGGGGFQRTIPKDEQDQMLFDGQSSTFFAFLLEKVGVEKVKELIRAVQAGTEGRDFIARSDMLGDDYGKIEEDWLDWLKSQEPASADFRPGSPQADEIN
jgi:hypothetical protein